MRPDPTRRASPATGLGRRPRRHHLAIPSNRTATADGAGLHIVIADTCSLSALNHPQGPNSISAKGLVIGVGAQEFDGSGIANVAEEVYNLLG